jgi:hypothetical protein
MSNSLIRALALGVVLAAAEAVCQAQGQPIPTLSQAQLSHMLQSQISHGVQGRRAPL